MPGFDERMPANTIAALEKGVAARVLAKFFESKEPSEQALTPINGATIAKIITENLGVLQKMDPATRMVSVTGSKYYMQAVRESAFRKSTQDIFGAEAESDEELMSVEGKISPDGLRHVVAVLFNTIHETPEDPNFTAMGGASIRLYVLEMERSHGANSDEVESLKQSIRKMDEEAGLRPEESERAWQVARMNLAVWDAFDHQEKPDRPASQELVNTAPPDPEFIKQLGQIVDQTILKKELEPPGQQSKQIEPPEHFKEDNTDNKEEQ